MDTAAQSTGVLSFEAAYEVVREHCRKILQSGEAQSEEVLLLQALGRVLAEPVVADRDLPPFPRATRDGFAVRAQDLQNGTTILRVVGQVRAGDSYDLPVASGEAVEIMTGAAVPAGADAVVMVEHTERKSQELNHKGHPFDSSFAGSESLRAGYGAQRESEDRSTIDADDQILDIAGHQKPKPQEKTTQKEDCIEIDFVEIQRVVVAGENVVPPGAEARAGQELLPLGTRMGPAQIALAAAAGKASLKA